LVSTAILSSIDDDDDDGDDEIRPEGGQVRSELTTTSSSQVT